MSRAKTITESYQSHTIVCDKCGNSMTDCEGKQELENFAVSVGWQLGDKDFCSECREPQ